MAAIGRADFLVTWNFRHIANSTKAALIRETCRKLGYEPPELCTPLRFMEGYEPQKPDVWVIRELDLAGVTYGERRGRLGFPLAPSTPAPVGG